MSADPVTFATKQDIQTVVYKIEQGEIALGTNTSGGNPGASNSARVDFTSQQTLSNKTLIEPTIASIKNGTSTVVVPQKSGTIALTSDLPTISTNNGQIDVSSFVTLNGQETLRNKTIEAPKISTIVNPNNNSTLTLPTSSGTLALASDIPSSANLSNYVTKTGEETLTNKTLTNPKMNTIVTTSNNSTLTLPSSSGTLALASDIPSITSIVLSEIYGSGTSKCENYIDWEVGYIKALSDKLYIGYVELNFRDNDSFDITGYNSQDNSWQTHGDTRTITDAFPELTGLVLHPCQHSLKGGTDYYDSSDYDKITITFNAQGLHLHSIDKKISNCKYTFTFVHVKTFEGSSPIQSL